MRRVLHFITGEADAIPRRRAGPGLGSCSIVYQYSRVAASAAPGNRRKLAICSSGIMSWQSPPGTAIVWMGPACPSGALTPVGLRRRARSTWCHSPPRGGLGPEPPLHLVTRQGPQHWNENWKEPDSVPLAEWLFPPCQSQPDILSPSR